MQGQLLTSVEPLDAGSLLAGRYRILAKVGEGGFGVVYQACDSKHGRRLVAIKQIDLAALSSRQMIEATDTYNREVTLLSRLSHSNLPRIYDHFSDPTHWYLVMQYIEGETLEDALQRPKEHPLSLKEVLDIGVQLADVLRSLHTHTPPIIFRDVKPANVMRTRRGRLYLIDFGIARHFRPEQARDTGPLGSPGYAAPEQYGRAQSTAQTDIYGLGVTLNTLLTGRDPLDAEPAAPPPQLSDKTGQELRRLLEVMQAADPADRPRTMREVKERLLFIRHHRTRLVSLGYQALSFLGGLLIGSLPYLFWPILQFFSFLYPNDNLPVLLWPVVLPFYSLFKLWPLVLICQCLLAFYFLFLAHPRRHVLAIGILLMLALIYLAIFFGWLPSAGSLFN